VSARILAHQPGAAVGAARRGGDAAVFGHGALRGCRRRGIRTRIGLFINTLPVRFRSMDRDRVERAETQGLLRSCCITSTRPCPGRSACSGRPSAGPLLRHCRVIYVHSAIPRVATKKPEFVEGIVHALRQRVSAAIQLSPWPVRGHLGPGFDSPGRVQAGPLTPLSCGGRGVMRASLWGEPRGAPESATRVSHSARLEVLRMAERRLVVEMWNATEAAFPIRRASARAVRGAGASDAGGRGGGSRRADTELPQS